MKTRLLNWFKLKNWDQHYKNKYRHNQKKYKYSKFHQSLVLRQNNVVPRTAIITQTISHLSGADFVSSTLPLNLFKAMCYVTPQPIMSICPTQFKIYIGLSHLTLPWIWKQTNISAGAVSDMFMCWNHLKLHSLILSLEDKGALVSSLKPGICGAPRLEVSFCGDLFSQYYGWFGRRETEDASTIRACLFNLPIG